MAEIPKSIYAFRGRTGVVAHICQFPGGHRYVLAEPTDEMVDRLAWFIADISPEDRARGLRPISSEFERARRLLAAALSTEVDHG